MKNKRTYSRMPFFFAVLFAFNMAANFAHPVTPTIIQSLHLGDYMFGLAFASMSLCNFLFSPFWGKVSLAIGSRRTLLICGMGYALGQVFFALARTEIQLVLARMLSGGLCGGAYVCFLTYTVNKSSPQERGWNLTLNVTLQTVSSAAGFFVGGMLGEIDTLLPVWVQVGTIAFTSILFLLFLGDDASETEMPHKPTSMLRECNPFSAFLQCGKILTPLLLVTLLFSGLSNLGFTALDQCFNYFIRDQFGFSSKYNGIIKAALGILSLISNTTICLWILRRHTTSRYMVWIMLICTVSMLGVALITGIVPFVAVNIVFFAFYYISLPLAQDMVASLAKEGTSNLVMGSYNAMKNFGSIFGALFSGFIYEWNPRLPFLMGCVAFAAATVLAMLYVRMEKREKGA